MHTVAPLFEAGMVWAPEKHFAEEVIDECMAFQMANMMIMLTV